MSNSSSMPLKVLAENTNHFLIQTKIKSQFLTTLPVKFLQISFVSGCLPFCFTSSIHFSNEQRTKSYISHPTAEFINILYDNNVKFPRKGSQGLWWWGLGSDSGGGVAGWGFAQPRVAETIQGSGPLVGIKLQHGDQEAGKGLRIFGLPLILLSEHLKQPPWLQLADVAQLSCTQNIK